MIRATFYIDKNAVVRAFEMSGHAGYADAGSDIVCSAVTAISQTVIGTLDELLERKPHYEIEAKTGRIACELVGYEKYSKTEKMAINTLMFSVLIGIKQLLPNYGEYIEVRELEYLEDRND